jgi:hypothetical protein
MGYMAALALAESLPLEDAVRLHFSTNCVPSPSSLMVAPALIAIAAARSGDWIRVIDLPAGASNRCGMARRATVKQLVKNLRLDAFVHCTEHTDFLNVLFIQQGMVLKLDAGSFRDYLAGRLPE